MGGSAGLKRPPGESPGEGSHLNAGGQALRAVGMRVLLEELERLPQKEGKLL